MTNERSTFMEADFEDQKPWDAAEFVDVYNQLADKRFKERLDISNTARLQVLELTYSRDENLDFSLLARQELARADR